ncbi:hypothetical protein [Bordetella avium]|uniref:hypothetical protein n=1 Tax=Bordetella avium TaxID=521 RepID=UPI000E678984|nr:hypothetical protein [Bordetella avium]RIQ51027.1 hypothetical protein D0843_11080 [Bordetella avium]
MSKIAMPEPFVLIQKNPWGGHAEVIRSARGEDGVIDCYTTDQMEAYAAAKMREALEEAANIAINAPITADMLDSDGAKAVSFHASARIRALIPSTPA